MNSRYRQLVRSDGFSKDRSSLVIEAMTWRSEKEDNTLEVPISSLPEEVQQLIGKSEFPIWLLCQMNLGAETAAQLDLGDFQIAPVADLDDDLT